MANERTVTMRGIEVTEAELVAKLEEVRKLPAIQHGDVVQCPIMGYRLVLSREQLVAKLGQSGPAFLTVGENGQFWSEASSDIESARCCKRAGTLADFLKERT